MRARHTRALIGVRVCHINRNTKKFTDLTPLSCVCLLLSDAANGVGFQLCYLRNEKFAFLDFVRG